MLSLEPVTREYEIRGLAPIEVRMYDLAWKHNRDGLGYVGLCELWYREISPSITLRNIKRVWDRMDEFMFFHTDIYYELFANSTNINRDYIPCPY